jgi:hypothetical protein
LSIFHKHFIIGDLGFIKQEIRLTGITKDFEISFKVIIFGKFPLDPIVNKKMFEKYCNLSNNGNKINN